jgi:molybdopterin molybdotransferase
MILVAEAERIILEQARDYGTEEVSFDDCLGRVLAENIYADRDFPPFDRVTMDGIAIKYESFEKGIRLFQIVSTQSAGEKPFEEHAADECTEIMTGAALPSTTNTVIPYEDVDMKNGAAIIRSENVLPGQYIHKKGKDKKQHEILAEAGQFISPAFITVAASAGKTTLLVKKLPRVIVISTGDELVGVDTIPTAFQVRRSNDYTLQAVLQQFCLHTEQLHLPDHPDTIYRELHHCLNTYEVMIITGGVSMGKSDHVPAILEKLAVKKLFHKVQQRPGKPFWFGTHAGGALVFAFPGNPVSGFMCLHRYFLPWLKSTLQVRSYPRFAILNQDFIFRSALQYFLQVKLEFSRQGELLATPVEGHGSGDFINLLLADGFLELPFEKNEFRKGEIYPLWLFKQMN